MSHTWKLTTFKIIQVQNENKKIYLYILRLLLYMKRENYIYNTFLYQNKQ